MYSSKIKFNSYMREWRRKNKEKVNLVQAKWREENREKIRENDKKNYHIRTQQPGYMEEKRQKACALAKKSRLKLTEMVVTAYGGKCACCGETQKEFLTIDHVNGDGAKHRKELKRLGGTDFYRWLKLNNYPSGFQVLCRNCNWAKFFCNECPHHHL